MNVLLISQCNKNALTETRRILDQFAERRGERTWQTPITMEGLKTLRQLLKKTARKNTAVACHWIRGKDHSELLWVVGDASRFNAMGAVPTNTTENDILKAADENDWHSLEIINVLAQLAGLMHDLGKSIVSFQERLKNNQRIKNLYRHEWVSLRLLQAFVGQDSDENWLNRLASNDYSEQDWLADSRLIKDKPNEPNPQPFLTLPPVAAALGWLIVSHHRLPQLPSKEKTFDLKWLEDPLSRITSEWNEETREATEQEWKTYWSMKASLPVTHLQWQIQAKKLAQRLLDCLKKDQLNWLENPYIMHLSRLSLMLSDHYYSSLGMDEQGQPVAERKRFLVEGDELKANTTKDKYGHPILNQSLTEHLLGVAHGAGAVAHSLPAFERYLPRLANHRGLRKRTKNARFAWQDKAYDAALGVQAKAAHQGAFVINMASTGCGKTIANARILYGLSHPQYGMRATYALGLRTLTLQTGSSYQKDLHLDDDELAVLVGGAANKDLFEYYQEQAEATGSASTQDLLEEDSHILYEGNTADHPLLSRALKNPDIKRLISAPMLVCTIDHLVPATEAKRGGRQIAPMLRLMSSDIILDELDDYGLEDMPALSRFVYWAGLLGSRIVLSSATLPPALIEGMFMAYRQGRMLYLKNRGEHGGSALTNNEIPCLWVDEFGVSAQTCLDLEQFKIQHSQFIEKRVKKLSAAPCLRQLDFIPVDDVTKEGLYEQLAQLLLKNSMCLHQTHHSLDKYSKKQVSFGIIRLANIEPIISIAEALNASPVLDDYCIHLNVYHSRFPLVQRSAIENMLDRCFNRRESNGEAVFELPEVRQAIDSHSAQNHLFIVLASPVCEVGRDWDADWAIAEPSSMRALIQLAGRVQRHRQQTPTEPNMLVLDAPIRYLKRQSIKDPIYIRPGFEKANQGPSVISLRVAKPWFHQLAQPDEYRNISATPRIQPRPEDMQNPDKSLADLEQARIRLAMYPRAAASTGPRRRGGQPTIAQQYLEREESAPSWFYPQAALTALLAQCQPFRESNIKTETLVFLPDEDEEQLEAYRVESNPAQRWQSLYVKLETNRLEKLTLKENTNLKPWGSFNLKYLLQQQAEYLGANLITTAKRMGTVELIASESGWHYHPWFGFINKK